MKNILLLLSLIGFFAVSAIQQHTRPPSETRNIFLVDTTYKVEPNTGLLMAPNYELVIANCTGCHSSRIILQYGADRNTWLEKIRWMQRYHKLWDLGANEALILDYLSKNYPPSEKTDRRKPLGVIRWYELEKNK